MPLHWGLRSVWLVMSHRPKETRRRQVSGMTGDKRKRKTRQDRVGLSSSLDLRYMISGLSQQNQRKGDFDTAPIDHFEPERSEHRIALAGNGINNIQRNENTIRAAECRTRWQGIRWGRAESWKQFQWSFHVWFRTSRLPLIFQSRP